MLRHRGGKGVANQGDLPRPRQQQRYQATAGGDQLERGRLPARSRRPQIQHGAELRLFPAQALLQDPAGSPLHQRSVVSNLFVKTFNF